MLLQYWNWNWDWDWDWRCFESKADYPPEKEDDPSLVGYSLAITISDKTHTTAWTNTSKEMPDSIKKVIDEIKKVVTKEKVV